jgi:hypothetical protein
MLAADRAVHDCGSGFDCNLACGARSNRAIDYRDSRPVLINIFYHVFYELLASKWEANMHNVTLGDGCGLIDIYTKGVISALHNVQ